VQDTSQVENYDAIIAAGNYATEAKVNINGVDYGIDSLISLDLNII